MDKKLKLLIIDKCSKIVEVVVFLLLTEEWSLILPKRKNNDKVNH